MEVPVFLPASQILARLKTVDANDSGLNANTLQGYVATDFASASALSGYLRTTGADVGATSQRQVFTNGITGPSWRPASNSTTALQMQDAAGTAIVTVNTVTPRMTVNGSILLPDSKSLYLGTDLDIDFYHDGTTGAFYNSTGQFQFRNVTANQIIFFTNNTSRMAVGANGGVFFGGTTNPTAFADIAASTNARASLRIRSGVAPTSPNDGDIWQDGTDLKMYIGGVTKTFTLV